MDVKEANKAFLPTLEMLEQNFVPANDSEKQVFDAFVRDARDNADGRYPSLWVLDGNISFVEYCLQDGKVERTKFGRYMRRSGALPNPDAIFDKTLESVYSQIAGILAYKPDLMKVYTDVEQGYRECSYASCVNNQDAVDHCHWYTENGVVLLVWEGNSRALVWPTGGPNGEKLMDRIYPNDGTHIAAFRRWAADNNAYIRGNNAKPPMSQGFVKPFNHIGPAYHCALTLNRSTRGVYPYVDTLRHIIVFNDDTLTVTDNPNRTRVKVLDYNGSPFEETRKCRSCANRYATRLLNELGLCPHCVANCWKCDACGVTHLNSVYAYKHADMTLCEGCWDALHYECEDCGCTVLVEDAEDEGWACDYDAEHWFCENCVDDRRCKACDVVAFGPNSYPVEICGEDFICCCDDCRYKLCTVALEAVNEYR